MAESPYIFGIHEPGGEPHMLAANRPGWIVFTEALAADPFDQRGGDYLPYAQQGLGTLVRLNYGYEPDGTIPPSYLYADFARRCAAFVANSQGCNKWIIGNEMNLSVERPLLGFARSGVRPGEPSENVQLRSRRNRADLLRPQPIPRNVLPDLRTTINGREVITPQLYVDCYRQCRAAIRALPGHSDDQVLLGAIAPWNNETQYLGNEIGDWVKYLQDILALLGTGNLDGITLHLYTHGTDPALISDSAPMDAPFAHRQFNFLAYRDFMNAIPSAMRQLPVYITEVDQIEPWLDVNSGWVQRAYAEIDWWNRQTGNQQIQLLALYRWPPIDQWVIEGKSGVIEDFRSALQNEYRWRPVQPPLPVFRIDDLLKTNTTVNVRRSAGYTSKPIDDIVARLPTGAQLRVLKDASTTANGLVWWNVRTTPTTTPQAEGWIAQLSPTSETLLTKIGVLPSLQPGAIQTGATVQTRSSVRMRASPGYLNKPPSDILKELPAGQNCVVLGGPSSADALTWWLLRTQVGSASGWVAEKLANGTVLIEALATAPPPVKPTLAFAVNDLLTTTDAVRVRKSPGSRNKPADDTLGAFIAETTLNVIQGPQTVDGLNWWNVGGITLTIGEAVGWVAQATAENVPLIQYATKLPGTAIPDKTTGQFLAMPFLGSFGIAQLWGENPAIYSQFSYDGVRLLGHNGIDFLTPEGTFLLATDAGSVLEAVSNDPTGFGNYVRLRHNWGESIYAHMLDFAVSAGQPVNRGTLIGRSGNTGFSSGPHLHFAIRIYAYSRTDGWGGYSDPLPYLNPAEVKLPYWVLPPIQRIIQRILSGKRQIPGIGYLPDKRGVERP